MTDDGWQDLAAGLAAAGRALDEATAGLDDIDRTDARLALLRAANNLLGRIESDRDAPELMPFNGWRQKFFMDNPDYRYWITDLRDDGRYRITGNVADSVYQSITVYAGTDIAKTTAVARVDTDGLEVDPDGNFDITLCRNDTGAGAWLALPEGSTSVWVRYIHDRVDPVHPGWCRISALGSGPAGPQPASDRLGRDLSRLGAFVTQLPQLLGFAVDADLKEPNSVRHWSAMAGGAAFTEPGIHYLRGAWQLEPDEALVAEGPLVTCRHWNIVLYNRFLNSLDYRHSVVTRTAATSSVTGGTYRFAIAGRDPRAAGYDWLDTGGRRFGLFVLRFLQPDAEPGLPTLRRVRIDELGAGQ
ncbi:MULTISPECIES: DUF1214 domain-containing protein [Mycobacterium]|uniref:DUF1214 domain-containing protein n=1 Tax=Mycobacterium kiyosense TaxID=2871094 RepID=A0A9P3UXM9_9MYCO|nr:MULTISPECIES: DUF1214 domain-containing protein [Mycobacterium]BDB39764.1 hypothetical protein IWGMT90018_02100 [Mycobacterium kiyosense]BDE11619.1 hypothetical protein MKCMC460_04790 [Mycobacterium sp. 20KCMC460]GLB81897.1 hypothetical protein SRL2020028_11530 [Mycobacterium kiyosense]GLB88143.1 hypothetical protein SRL2020130_09600 [Mycobacterium kiyosense]GLB95703.1 hypothetical protein SRL2020226_24790 [Mycobacterium kiyosense]